MNNNDQFAHSLQQALLLHQQGQLEGAQVAYQLLIQAYPQSSQPYYFLGLLNQQQSRYQEALGLIEQALQLEPKAASYWKAKGDVLTAIPDINAAEAAYKKAVAFNKEELGAQIALGNLFAQKKQWEKAAKYYRQVLKLQPGNINAQMNLSNLALEQGQYPEAEEGYRKLLAADQNQPHILNNLGKALAGQNIFEEAEQCYQRALTLLPDYAHALNNLGDLYLQKNNPVAASSLFENLLALDEKNVAAMVGQARCLLAFNNVEESIRYLQRALKLSPEDIEAINGLGNCYFRIGEYQQAVSCYEQVLVLNPKYKHAQLNLALALQKLGQTKLACKRLESLLKQSPDYLSAVPYLMHFKRQLCDWKGIEKLTKQSLGMLKGKNKTYVLPPFSLITLPEATSEEQMLAAQYWQVQHESTIGHDSQNKLAVDKRAPDKNQKKIRLGYVSADFHQHATAILLVRIIELHNRDEFEVMGYSFGPDDKSAMRDRVVNAFDEFYDVQDRSAEQIAKLIRQHEVDVLLDVKGLTQNNRAEVFLHRPAPIQVNYLAYPATMASAKWDYFIGDNFITPPDLQAGFSEKIINLSGCYQPADDQRDIPAANSRSELSLPEDKVILAAFHQAYKLSPKLLDVWSNILKQTPQSLLWLLADDKDLQQNLSKELAKRGVKPYQYQFAKKVDQKGHLDRLAAADLFLDAFPVNAHTTASDALWAGVPVLTVSGDTMISRVAGSLLKGVEMDELISGSFKEYGEKAVQLINEPESLQAYKQRLITGRKTLPLFNSEEYTCNLEVALHKMWQSYLNA